MFSGVFMIIDFMKKMRSELTDRKLKLESEQNRIQGELNRNNKFLQNLKQEEDQSYDVFSPRRKNSIMYSNICELEKKRDILIKELEEIKNELIQINSRLEEVDNLIKDIRIKNKNKITTEHKEMNKSNICSERNIVSMIKKIDLCLQLLRIDPNRCKLELSAVKKSLQEMQKEGINDGSN